MLDIGYTYTSEKEIEKDLDKLEYLTVEEKEKIKQALLNFYQTIATAKKYLKDNRRDKFVDAMLNQLSYDIGEAMISFDELGYYYKDNPMEYVKQLEGYNAKELVKIARKEYRRSKKELECYADDQLYEDIAEWVDVLY